MNEQYGYRIEVFKVENGIEQIYFTAKPKGKTDRLATLLLNMINALASLRAKVISNERKKNIISNGILNKKSKKDRRKIC